MTQNHIKLEEEHFLQDYLTFNKFCDRLQADNPDMSFDEVMRKANKYVNSINIVAGKALESMGIDLDFYAQFFGVELREDVITGKCIEDLRKENQAAEEKRKLEQKIADEKWELSQKKLWELWEYFRVYNEETRVCYPTADPEVRQKWLAKIPEGIELLKKYTKEGIFPYTGDSKECPWSMFSNHVEENGLEYGLAAYIFKEYINFLEENNKFDENQPKSFLMVGLATCLFISEGKEKGPQLAKKYIDQAREQFLKENPGIDKEDKKYEEFRSYVRGRIMGLEVICKYKYPEDITKF